MFPEGHVRSTLYTDETLPVGTGLDVAGLARVVVGPAVGPPVAAVVLGSLTPATPRWFSSNADPDRQQTTEAMESTTGRDEGFRLAVSGEVRQLLACTKIPNRTNTTGSTTEELGRRR
jgi:hypothetical protein